jgi:hypothetical protein
MKNTIIESGTKGIPMIVIKSKIKKNGNNTRIAKPTNNDNQKFFSLAEDIRMTEVGKKYVINTAIPTNSKILIT